MRSFPAAAAAAGAIVAAWGAFLAAMPSGDGSPTLLLRIETGPDAPRAPAAPAAPERLRLASVIAELSSPELVVGEERFEPPAGMFPKLMEAPPDSVRPRIALIVDDLGLDDQAYEAVLGLPGPLTLSFLPYGRSLDVKARRARAQGHALMLHLPMEPLGDADPGPRALRRDLDERELASRIAWSLGRFDGYTGVNNHMGSALTRDRVQMTRVMGRLRGRASYFLDSVTIGDSLAAEEAEAAGIPAFRRDVFLDAAPGRAAFVSALGDLEEKAKVNGVAIGILHPRETSLEAIGAWLASAPARGFELVTMDDLAAERAALRTAARPPHPPAASTEGV